MKRASLELFLLAALLLMVATVCYALFALLGTMAGAQVGGGFSSPM